MRERPSYLLFLHFVFFFLDVSFLDDEFFIQFFPFFLTWIKALRTDGVALSTDCKAHWNFVILAYINQNDFTLRPWNLWIMCNTYVHQCSSFSSHRQTHLAQGGVLHCDLTEEEVDVVAVVDGVQEVRLCREREREKCVIDFFHFQGKTLLMSSFSVTSPSVWDFQHVPAVIRR